MISFWKVQASGNDFIVCLKAETLPADKYVDLAIKLCERRFSIGADGFIVLSQLSKESVSWEFFNSDGSDAGMCGNAARAIGKLAVEELGLAKNFELHTGSGKVGVQYISPDQIQIQMPRAEFVNAYSDANIWDTGVPHSVIETKFSKLEDLLPLVKTYRYPSVLNEKGANVSFWYEQDSGHLKAVSFERGVEDFTLACGTGATACALDAMKKNPELKERTIYLDLPGGSVGVNYNEAKNLVFLVGSAEVIFRGEWREK